MTTAKKRWTWAEMYEWIGEDMDVADGDLVSENWVQKKVNDAIDAAEAVIQTEHPQYFVTYQEPTALEAGIDALDCPENLYGDKIIKIILNDGTTVYECDQLFSLQKFMQYRQDRVNLVSEAFNFGFFLANESESGPRILLTPAPTSGTWSYEIWYHRQANRIEDDEDLCDLPEAMGFIWAYVEEAIESKRRKGSVAHQTAIAKLAKAEGDMINAFQCMVKDASTEVAPNMAPYEDMN